MRRATALAVPVRPGQSSAISSQFTLKVCSAAENRKNH